MKRFVVFLFFILFKANLYPDENIIIGTEEGIYSKNLFGYEKIPILTNEKIIDIAATDNGYYFLSENGLYLSKDLKQYVKLENGIRKDRFIIEEDHIFRVIEKDKRFKRIKIDKNNPQNIIIYSKKDIYISTNSGEIWQKLTIYINEITAAEISSENKTINIYISHPYNGIFLYNFQKKSIKNISKGINKFNAFFYNDISDINFINGEIYATSFFERELYKFDKKKFSWENIQTIEKDEEVIYSFGNIEDKICFVMSDSIEGNEVIQDVAIDIFEIANVVPYCVLIDKKFSFSSLEILFEEENENFYRLKANNRKGIYISPYALLKRKNNIENFIPIMEKKGLNTIVLDMKDDYGYLHYKPDDPDIKKIAKTLYPVDIDKIVRIAREKNIYLIARIVVFKDSVLYKYNNYEYAVRDKRDNSPWVGMKTNELNETNNIKEYWVDPYNTSVWKYIVAIANELVKKGFDEIQFDYIRFPTDGLNLKYATFPAQNGFTKEEAIFSFLRYAREHIDAPISIDIYGNNGWYRSGGVTGQDVELLADYVDVICPMFYPSHFDQRFLNYEPFDKRPYRIYYYGTLRTYHMARKKIIPRPYVQHFRLNVSYDREYYNEEYISNEIKGIEDSVNMGYIFWNMEGKY
ncbi:MAG: putative glycoside hydrolase [Brevinematales bacterium]|nr:putative glycoside hydrolase [Brevinematales bacterium]